MRPNKLALVFIVAACFLFVSLTAYAADQEVVLSTVKGVVEIIPQGATEGSAGISGARLKEGDTVKTYDRSRAEITFQNAGVVTMQSNSLMVIRKAQMNGDVTETVTDLRVGEIQAKVKKFMSASSKFETMTPVAVAAVRGTTYKVTVTQNGETTVYVVEGEVALQSLLTNLGVTLQPGQNSTVGTSGNVSEPQVTVEVVEEEDLDALKDKIKDPTDVSDDVIEGESHQESSPFE